MPETHLRAHLQTTRRRHLQSSLQTIHKERLYPLSVSTFFSQLIYSPTIEVAQGGSFFFEPSPICSGLELDPSLLWAAPDKPVYAVVSNQTELSLTLEEGELLGEGTPVDAVKPSKGDVNHMLVLIYKLRNITSPYIVIKTIWIYAT